MPQQLTEEETARQIAGLAGAAADRDLALDLARRRYAAGEISEEASVAFAKTCSQHGNKPAALMSDSMHSR